MNFGKFYNEFWKIIEITRDDCLLFKLLSMNGRIRITNAHASDLKLFKVRKMEIYEDQDEAEIRIVSESENDDETTLNVKNKSEEKPINNVINKENLSSNKIKKELLANDQINLQYP